MAGLMGAGGSKLPYKEIYTNCTVTGWSAGWGALITKDSVFPNSSSGNTVRGTYLKCTTSSGLRTTVQALKACKGEYVYFSDTAQVTPTSFSVKQGETILDTKYNGGTLLVFVR